MELRELLEQALALLNDTPEPAAEPVPEPTPEPALEPERVEVTTETVTHDPETGVTDVVRTSEITFKDGEYHGL